MRLSVPTWGVETGLTALVVWTFAAGGLAPVIPRLMGLPLLDRLPYLHFLVFLPGVLAGTWMYLRHPRRIRAAPMLVIIALMVTGLAWTFPTERGRGIVELALVAVPLALAVLITRRRDWLRAVVTYLLASSIAAIYLFHGWLDEAARTGLSADRYGALYDDSQTRIMEPNITATHLAFGGLLVAILWLAPGLDAVERRWRLIGTACLPVLFAGVVLSGSRGGVLSLLGALTALAAFTAVRRRLPLRTNVLVGAGLVALAAVLLLAPNPVSQRIDLESGTTTHEASIGADADADADGGSAASRGYDTRSFGGRTDIWRAALDASVSSPAMALFGAGTGGADHAVAVANPDLVIARVGEHNVLRANAHSSYLYWLVSFGVVGMLVAGAALGVIAVFALDNDWAQGWGVGTAMLVFFLLTSVTLIAMRLEATSIAVSALTLGYVLPRRGWAA
jgi:hypothetical protein